VSKREWAEFVAVRDKMMPVMENGTPVQAQGTSASQRQSDYALIVRITRRGPHLLGSSFRPELPGRRR